MTDRHESIRTAGGDRPPDAPGPVPGRDLGRALRDLPRERAAAGFTRRVLDRLDSTNGSPVPLPAPLSVPRSRRSGVLGSGWSGGLRWAAASALAAVALATLVTRVALEVEPFPEVAEVPPPVAVAEATPTEAPAPPAAPATPTPSVTTPTAPAAPAAAPASASRAERLAALDAERARIARELAEIRRLAREPLPVVYVGGDETVDFVVDLQSLSRMARLDGSGLGDRTLRPAGTTIEDPERNPR